LVRFASENQRRLGCQRFGRAQLDAEKALRDDRGASLTSLRRSAFGGVAAAMARPNLMPSLMPSAPGKPVMAVRAGNYKGYGALGAGATYRLANGEWRMASGW